VFGRFDPSSRPRQARFGFTEGTGLPDEPARALPSPPGAHVADTGPAIGISTARSNARRVMPGLRLGSGAELI